ncbi:MAG: HAMP domain-containing sensor histidine kinase [Solirubrobacteraceae bacterium]|nr:HAMP domain-containing sensor histidine kinase [Solirubrobacteraceae bacterium]
MSLRARVAAAAVVAIVVAVALLGVTVSTLLGAQLTGALDDALRSRAVEVARLAASTPDLLTEPGALEGRITGGALFVQVVDARERIVARSGGLGGRVLPSSPALRGALGPHRRTGFADGALGSEPIRLYAAPLGELGGSDAAGGAVLVAGTTADIDDTLATTRRIILLCALVAAALAALLATLLARRALAPVRRLSSGARAIEHSGDASERLPVPGAGDEVGELAGTLNAMLASLQRARAAEQRFVADASHELRTPLTALRGNAAFVVRHGADPAVLADIEADAARLSALLDDLLALAREDAAAASALTSGEPVVLAKVARTAARSSASGGEDEAGGGDGDRVAARDGDGDDDAGRVRVVVEPGAGAAAVLGEPLALERAVANLIRNARDHGPAGGRITVTVGVEDERASISVSDEGPGLDDAAAEQAFERFWRAPGAGGEGSGLGLAIVRAIAERHGGCVSVRGSRFTIELPAFRDLSRSGRTTSS